MAGSPRGYPLPDLIDPPDDLCLAVHIPNDPAYLRAFWGAYEELGQWWFWERDISRRGKDAAARWRDAVLATHATWEQYGDLCTLQITVNLQCDCQGGSGTTVYCGGCCSPGDYIPYPGAISPDDISTIPTLPTDGIDDGSTPPPGWGTYPEYLQDKCNRAYQTVEDFMSTLANFGSFGAMLAALSTAAATAMITAGALSPLIVGLMAVGFTVSGAMAVLIGLFVSMAFLGSSVFLYFNIVLASLDQDALVCCLYEAPDVPTAQTCLRTEVGNQALAALAAEPGPVAAWLDLFNSLVELITPPFLFSILFAGADLLDSLAVRDCSHCNWPPQTVNLPAQLIFSMPFPQDSAWNQERVTGDYLYSEFLGISAIQSNGRPPTSILFNGQTTWMEELVAGDYPLLMRDAGSISFWAYLHTDAVVGRHPAIAHWHISVVDGLFLIESNDDNTGMRFTIGQETTQGLVVGPTGFKSVWHHWGVTWLYTPATNNLTIKYYHNGSLSVTSPSGVGRINAPNTSFKMRIGAIAGPNSLRPRWHGGLDSINMWSRQINDAEMAALYNNNIGLNPIP